MHLRFYSEIPVSCPTLWRWHERALAPQRLMPPRPEIEIASAPALLREGEELHLKVPLLPFLTLRGIFYLERVDPKSCTFIDVQRKGPFHSWRHLHHMHPIEDHKISAYHDEITCLASKFHLVNEMLEPFMAREMKKAFALRHHIVAWDTFWFENYPLRAPPIIFSFKKSRFGKTLQAFFSPFRRTKEEYHRFRQHQLEFRPQVIINALDGMIGTQAVKSFTERLVEIGPSKCIVIYKNPKLLEELAFIEHYCRYPVFFDCSALIEPQRSLRPEIFAAKFHQSWLCEDELLAALWLALYDYTYSDQCRLFRSLPSKGNKSSKKSLSLDRLKSPLREEETPLFSSKAYSKIIDERGLTWKRFQRLYQ